MTSEVLLEEIKKNRFLDADEVQKLKRETLLSGRSAEDIIFEKKLIADDKLADFKSRLLNIPYEKIDFSTWDEGLLNLVPEETVRTYGVVPLGKHEDTLVIGMLQPDDPKAQDALKFLAKQNHLNLGVYLISYSDWRQALKRYSPFKSSVEAAVKNMNLPTSGKRVVSLEENLAKGVEEAPVIKIVAEIFEEAVRSGASDVHIEPQQNYLRIRLRNDGDLKEALSLPAEISAAVVSRVKVISSLKIDESRIPQDGRFRARLLDREIDFRVATFPTPLGEKVAIRVLDPTTGLKSMADLGLTGANLAKVEKGLQKPYGMILLTGPTGSGKTTTLYALLQRINEERVNIVSLEDPVEYFVTGINQSQVRPEIGYDFASGLRQILRQDPDVIMVGEIRDNETAGLAVQAALTGHIVLSTLHTNNSAGVIPRLLDMKVEPFLLPVSLSLMIAQRLVGRLCPNCKTVEEPAENIAKIIERSLTGIPDAAKYKKPYKIYRAKGCPTCKGKGVLGRVAIFEVLEMTPELEEVINAGSSIQKILSEAKRQGMIGLRPDGIMKALDGLVSVEEVIGMTEEV